MNALAKHMQVLGGSRMWVQQVHRIRSVENGLFFSILDNDRVTNDWYVTMIGDTIGIQRDLMPLKALHDRPSKMSTPVCTLFNPDCFNIVSKAIYDGILEKCTSE